MVNRVSITTLSHERCILPIHLNLAFKTNQNFLRKALYAHDEAIVQAQTLLEPMAEMLCKAQDFFVLNYGCTLILHDGYRTKQCAQEIAAWLSHQPSTSDKDYFPHHTKQQLLKQGYIKPYEYGMHVIEDEVHVTLGDARTNKPLPMGSPYQFFDKTAHSSYVLHSDDEKRYRYVLNQVMMQFGFKGDEQVYWRYKFMF
jgi:D-alanyl-D-alanine dipeptidase